MRCSEFLAAGLKALVSVRDGLDESLSTAPGEHRAFYLPFPGLERGSNAVCHLPEEPVQLA